MNVLISSYRHTYVAIDKVLKQQILVSLKEKWKATLDKNGYAAAVLMDLSKPFGTINHDLLIAKLKPKVSRKIR